MPEALDPLPLLAALHERGIEYIVVGGFAHPPAFYYWKSHDKFTLGSRRLVKAGTWELGGSCGSFGLGWEGCMSWKG
jgi:hypothetical protein